MISLLGTLAIAVGAAAWFATRAPILGEGPVVIGACGIVLGLLAMLGSSLLGNTGKFIPLVGLLTCGSAIGFGATHNTTGVGAVNQLKQLVDRFRPASAPTPINKPAAPPSSLVPSSPALVEDKPVGSGTIFDMTPTGKDSSLPAGPPEQQPAPLAQAANIGTATPTLPAPNASQRYIAAMKAVSRAQAKVDATTAALIPGLSTTAAYHSAKSELEVDTAALTAARVNNTPGSPELVDAAQRYVNAKTTLQKIVNQAAANDPQALAAKQELITAQSDLRAAKEDLTNSSAAGKN
jgi:hypothetical protein